MTLACIIMIPAFALYEFIQVWQGKKTYKVSANVKRKD